MAIFCYHTLMLQLKNLGIILEKTSLDFENQAVLNPACICKDGVTHMYYRAVSLGNFSSIGYCQIKDHKVIERLDRPLIIPEYHFEQHGMEDPRVVEVEGIYYLFYTAYDGKNIHTAYATSNDLLHFEKQGIISPTMTYHHADELFKTQVLNQKYDWYEKHYEQAIMPGVLLWEKDVFMFPKKFDGKFILGHRIMPGIQLLSINNLTDLNEKFWGNYLQHLDKHILLDPKFWYESRKIGGGCIPLQTPEGWLLIYHGVQDTPHGNVYHASAALLDLADPTRVIGRLKEPLFSPSEPWEKNGDTLNVVFPTGAIIENDELTIYYGAADTVIAAKSCSVKELLAVLKQSAA